MPLHNYFIGLVAAVFGCYLILGTSLSAPWLMGLKRPRLLAQSLGPTAARWTLGAIGISLIVIGGLIASGWKVPWGEG